MKYHLYHLGDSALVIDYGNNIDEKLNDEVNSRFHQFNSLQLPWVKDLVPAYSSLTIHYDLLYLSRQLKSDSVFDYVKDFVREKIQEEIKVDIASRDVIRIPLSYDEESAPDIKFICESKNITREEVIRIFCSRSYRIYMLGFLPGFPYMGEVDERIAVGRKEQPVNVKGGSVGIAGKQTGIYPLDSPGGWQIIGRTPLKLFNAGRENPVLLKAGTMVEFYAFYF